MPSLPTACPVKRGSSAGLAPAWCQLAGCPHPRYFEEIFNASGNLELVRKYGDWFTYDKNPRAQIFRRNQTLVHDLDSMIRLMRCVLGTPKSGCSTKEFSVIHGFFPCLHRGCLLALLQVQQLPAGPTVVVQGL